MTRRLVALLAMGALTLAACGGDDPADRQAVQIEVTTTLLADVVGSIVGDLGEVHAVLPIGASPHDFQPSPRDVERIRAADAVIANGAGLEEGLADVLDAAVEDGVLLHHALETEDDGDVGQDDHGVDPHFFTDPVLMAGAVDGIAAFLVDAVPSLDEGTILGNAARVREELLGLDAELRDILAVVPADHRYLVTNHDAFGYFAERYEFTVVGTVIPSGSTADASSARDLAELAASIRELGIRAVFSETSASDDLARALAAEVGRTVEVIALYSGSLGPQGSGAETYAGLLRTNAQLIADGLT